MGWAWGLPEPRQRCGEPSPQRRTGAPLHVFVRAPPACARGRPALSADEETDPAITPGPTAARGTRPTLLEALRDSRGAERGSTPCARRPFQRDPPVGPVRYSPDPWRF